MTPLRDLGSAGIIRDQEGYELPATAWTDGLNVRTHQGWIGSVDGTASLITASAVPYWITPFYTATARYVVYAGLAKVYRHDGSTETDITPAPAPTAVSTDKWTGGILSGVLVANNGRDVPWSYAGTGTMATLGGWDANWKCKALRPFKNFLVALNITKTSTRYPYLVKWSHSLDPGSITAAGDWDETDPARDAGEFDLAETPDAVIDCLPLGDINIIYKERSAYGMQDIGGTQVFRFFRLPGELGMLAPGCAAQTPMGHVVLAQGDVYIHSGGEPRSIIDQRMRNWLFDTIDQSSYEACFVATNARRQEVWICFPESGRTSCTKALVWNWTSDTLTIRELQNFTAGCSGVLSYLGDPWSGDSGEWGSDETAWSDAADFNANDTRLFMTSTSSKILGVDTGSTFAGEPISSMVERRGLHLDKPDTVKVLTRLWPKFDAAAGAEITIEVGSSMNAEDDPDWQAAQTYTVGTTDKIDAITAGRYLALRFSSTDAWRTKTCDLEVVESGRF